ncbi:hypothetical protein JTE90_004657 [Oedothorax gibbosus]|uniref:Uncharacterized protein n=1 Tax=Oedothorax gibbosus TaxID=931172 RepID=A0AAV6UWT4_9ARAC|nr:hypothetical protein JTE90_004657 [Oedothorax gibbosus]
MVETSLGTEKRKHTHTQKKKNSIQDPVLFPFLFLDCKKRLESRNDGNTTEANEETEKNFLKFSGAGKRRGQHRGVFRKKK